MEAAGKTESYRELSGDATVSPDRGENVLYV